jgi:hypothetical protein
LKTIDLYQSPISGSSETMRTKPWPCFPRRTITKSEKHPERSRHGLEDRFRLQRLNAGLEDRFRLQRLNAGLEESDQSFPATFFPHPTLTVVP